MWRNDLIHLTHISENLIRLENLVKVLSLVQTVFKHPNLRSALFVQKVLFGKDEVCLELRNHLSKIKCLHYSYFLPLSEVTAKLIEIDGFRMEVKHQMPTNVPSACFQITEELQKQDWNDSQLASN